MKVSAFQKIASALVISLGAIATALPVQAGSLINGWNYARDDYSYDGYDSGNLSATSRYDIYGIGIKQVDNTIFVGINASMPLTGISSANTTNNNVGWGDLFLDFNYGNAGNNFATAQGSMIGIRFASTNDSSAPTTGVYTGVTGKAVAGSNSGFASLNHYATNTPNAVIGDLAINDPYFAPYQSAPVPNEIGAYSSKIGEVTQLSVAELASLPSIQPPNDSTHPNRFGFKFDLPSSYTGNFLGSLFLECVNDAVAIKGYVRPVPVPPAIAGILAVGALGGWRAAKRKKQLKSIAA